MSELLEAIEGAHSPGPWAVRADHQTFLVDAAGRSLAQFFIPDPLDVCWEETIAANVRLAAAAPAMAQACLLGFLQLDDVAIALAGLSDSAGYPRWLEELCEKVAGLRDRFDAVLSLALPKGGPCP